MTFDTSWDWLQGPAVAMVSLGLAVLGALLSIIFYFRSLREQRLQFAIETDTLISQVSPDYPDLQVQYAGKAILVFSVATVYVWNAGRETIKASNIVPTDPLLIRPEGNTDILDYSLRKVRRLQNDVRVKREGEACSISFGYLGYRDWIAVQVLHTSSTRRPLKFSGLVEGKDEIAPYRPHWFFQLAGLWAIMAMLLGMAAVVAILRAVPNIPGWGLLALMTAPFIAAYAVAKPLKAWNTIMPPFVDPPAKPNLKERLKAALRPTNKR